MTGEVLGGEVAPALDMDMRLEMEVGRSPSCISRAGATSPPRTSPVMKQEPSSPQALSRD
jgi:hypothetical protein